MLTFAKRILIIFFMLTTSFASASTLIIGVAGGTGSGKTTFTENIQVYLKQLGEEVTMITQDSYYRDLAQFPPSVRDEMNFDHPDSIDFTLLKRHIEELQAGRSIEKPVYSFFTHSREEFTETINPARIIVVEGILLFAIPELLDLFDVKIFIDTEADIRLLRRIERDTNERGRDFNNIKRQYLATVRPMHEAFVEPSKHQADIIIPHGGRNPIAIKVVIDHLISKIK